MHGVRLRYGLECRDYGDPPADWVAQSERLQAEQISFNLMLKQLLL